MRRIELTSPDGIRWVPGVPTGDGILTIAGSSGRLDEARARVLAGTGMVAETVRWFGGAGQHSGPWEIPLELFLERIEALRRECDRVWMTGTSFGSEAAMLCGAISSEVTGVIAFAPTHVVWAGHDGERTTSRWTLGDRSLPYVPFDREGYVLESPPRLRPLYERSLRGDPDRIAEATIPVERIRRLVVVAGGDDQVWPAAESAEYIRARRASHSLPTTVITEPDAGHRTILPGEQPVRGGADLRRGGSEDADRRLGTRAWSTIKDAVTSAR